MSKSDLLKELGRCLRPDQMYPIQNGIPLPRMKSKPHAKFPLNLMIVGDSFHALDIFDKKEMQRISAQVCSWAFAQKSDIKFTVRRFNGGIRVWRTE